MISATANSNFIDSIGATTRTDKYRRKLREVGQLQRLADDSDECAASAR